MNLFIQQSFMAEINVSNKDEVFIKVDCDDGIAKEVAEYFTFYVPGYRFMPAFKSKMWDGKIRLFNYQARLIYKGLLTHVNKFAAKRNYSIKINDDLNETQDISLNDAQKKFKDLPLTPRDYQYKAFIHAVRNKRSVILSPTASGKSLIIYMICKWYKGRKLIIVPTTSLVHQMDSDFISYGQANYTHKIMAGQEKNADAEIFISTWQSIYKQPKKWFAQFDVVIGDEAHLFKAQSLTKIMTKLEDCPFRYGFTGTLDDTQTHRLVLEGLFGPVMRVIKTQELIENKTLSDFRIKALVLKYPDEMKKGLSKASYQEEINFLISNPARNKFIKDLTLSRKGNTLLLFQMVEKHGKVLFEDINSDTEDRKVFFVYGGVDAETREEIRAITEQENDAIIVASYGTFSTGINIKNLHNIIFASPSKSRIRNLQSIGRGLRRSDKKESATLYDIADDLCWKSWNNHTLKHLAIRLKMYREEDFTFKIYNIRLNHGTHNQIN